MSTEKNSEQNIQRKKLFQLFVYIIKSFLSKGYVEVMVRLKGRRLQRSERSTSNVFAMFDQTQIQEFREAFNLIDQDRDGEIDKNDLRHMFESLGKNPTDEYIESMVNEAPGPITLTVFLTLFGDKLQGTDPEDVIKNAFASFDREKSGFIHEDFLKKYLTTGPRSFTKEQVDEMFRECPIDEHGMFNYIEFTRILKHGAKEEL